MSDATIKTCRSCGHKKHRYAFAELPSAIGGLRPDCKECFGRNRMARKADAAKRGRAIDLERIERYLYEGDLAKAGAVSKLERSLVDIRSMRGGSARRWGGRIPKRSKP